MGEEKEKVKEKKGDGEKKGEGEKKKEAAGPIVLKMDLHCEGCAMKVKRAIKGIEGVDSVTTDTANNKITVAGKADPWQLKERLETKTRKNVDIISPANPPKKDAAKDGDAKKGGADKPKEQKKSDDNKPKELPESTVVLKIRLHCEGCMNRIRRRITKIKGVKQVTVDAAKDLVTVKGTMDAKSLPAFLKEKLKRTVEIIPAKKEDGGGGGEKKEKKEGGDGAEKKEKKAEGGEKKEKKEEGGEKKEKKEEGGEKKEKKEEGGEKKEKKEEGGEKKEKNEGGEKPAAAAAPAPATATVEANKYEYYGSYGAPAEYYHGAFGAPVEYHHGSYGAPAGYYGPYYGHRAEMVQTPQLFSDENPNACSVM
ncbi:uncharacterized protein [Typha latifolia]|uniref:uncharacterized protein n=1 Tax=Typha latifolia TaxID=4733 RepID=UPI003C2C5ECF